MTTKDTFISFCKKKGFIYPSSEIYGGLSGFYDYGHLGTRLKHNFQHVWRHYFLNLHENFHEIEAAQIMHHDVFKASGHIKNFVDPIARCTKCGHGERADHLVSAALNTRVEAMSEADLTKEIRKANLKCSQCKGDFADVAIMNLMFPLDVGVGSKNKAYLRPETAQSPFVNFKQQYELLRKKLPLGLALIGKAFRNEISPRNFTLRQREFTQAELQIFFNPSNLDEHEDFDTIKDLPLRVYLTSDREKADVIERTAQELTKHFPKFVLYYVAKVQHFYLNILNIPKEKFRLYEMDEKERAFYNKYHFDVEVDLTGHGYYEIGGVHYRTDHDLKGHQEVSKTNLLVQDEATKEKFIPHVLELSFGVDRNIYTLLDLNLEEQAERGNAVLHLPTPVAPYAVAVFPLVKNKDPVLNKAKDVRDLLKNDFNVFFDITGSIGRRYARADEIGIPKCVTIDFETVEQDDMVTVRDRDSTKQERIKIAELANYLKTN